jgi:hypothetical protein
VKFTEIPLEHEAAVVVCDDTVIVVTYSTGQSGPMITRPSTHGAMQPRPLDVELKVKEIDEEDEIELFEELQVSLHVVDRVVDEIDRFSTCMAR